MKTALFGVLLIGVLQGSMVQGQQTTANQQGLLAAIGNYLNLRAQPVRAIPNDGDVTPGGFTPLPPLGPPGYGSPSFQVTERPLLNRPHQFNGLRPKPKPPGPPGRPYNQLGSNPPPRPPPPYLRY